MSTALPLTSRIRQDYTAMPFQAVLEIKLGNNYKEITADGQDSLRWKFENVGWDNLNSTDRATALSFFESVGYVGYVTWTPTGFSSKRFRIERDSWKESYPSGVHYSIAFNLIEE